ncbi:transmembrane adaptor Erv26-domain-containing protein [Pavlovales sp. CCMP2436]|nr:transmembrane adaptor Erv26-domain-containing protein [Pavlovales sp. CCMP2436]
MGYVALAVTYVAGYLFLVFVAICLACGLYYLAELCEEYTSLTKRVIYWAIIAILIEHVLLLVFERLPWQLVLLGMGSHCCYFQLLKSFPFLQLSSPAFLLSCVAVAVCTYGWVAHFASDYHSPAFVLGFLLANCWLVPFAFFISLSVNESVLPSNQHLGASQAFSEPGARRGKTQSGILSVFDFFRSKKEELMPGLTKKV